MCKQLILQRKFRPRRGFYEPDKVLDVLLSVAAVCQTSPSSPRRACRNERGLVLFADNFTATQTLFQTLRLSTLLSVNMHSQPSQLKQMDPRNCISCFLSCYVSLKRVANGRPMTVLVTGIQVQLVLLVLNQALGE